MTFIVPRKSLLAELELLRSVLDAKTLLPATAYVKVEFNGERLSLTTTNIDVTVISSVSAEGDAWNGCLPCVQLYTLLKLLSDDSIQFIPSDNPQGGPMKLRAGRSKHLLPVMEISNFPGILHPDSQEKVVLNLDLVAKMIAATSFSMLPPADHLKPVEFKYTGLSLRVVDSKLEIMATNAKVAAIAEASSDAQPFALALPRQAVTALQRLEGESVTMKHSENLVEFTSGPRSIIARQLMGQFPQWRMFVPELPLNSTISTGELQSAIKRAAVTMGTDNAVGYEEMRATFAKESVLIETKGGDKGKSEELVEAQSNLNGDALSIGFINSQVLDVLSKCGESVTCHLSDGDKPIVFKPVVGEFESTFIVMPVSLRAW